VCVASWDLYDPPALGKIIWQATVAIVSSEVATIQSPIGSSPNLVCRRSGSKVQASGQAVALVKSL